MPKLIEQPMKIKAAGNKPKVIQEFIGRANTQTSDVSIAHMESPPGWAEPGQTPEFDEYSVVLRGVLRVTTKSGVFDVKENQAIIVSKGEWVQYSSPTKEGASYIGICVPAFSMDTVHRDEK